MELEFRPIYVEEPADISYKSVSERIRVEICKRHLRKTLYSQHSYSTPYHKTEMISSADGSREPL